MKTTPKRPTGMVAFTTIWIGQIVSLLGTAMSQFGLTLWVYEVTGKATPLALVGDWFTVVRNAEDILPDHDSVATEGQSYGVAWYTLGQT